MAKIIRLEYEQSWTGMMAGYCAVWDSEPTDKERLDAKKENPEIISDRWVK